MNGVDPVCNGKVAFQSPNLARKAAGRGGKTREVYRCNSCGLWHCGDKPRRDKLKDRRPVAAAQRIW
jgi:hypothetical protein